MSASSSKHQSSPPSSTMSTNTADEPLYQVKLLSALRSGDPALIYPFLTEIGKDSKRKSEDGNLDTGSAALHLAIRCASASTVSLLLSHRSIPPNGVHPIGSGTTPLHLAASLGRADIVRLLLEQDGINDGLVDANGKLCTDVAKNKQVIRAIEDSRESLNASYRALLQTYILSAPNTPPSSNLLTLLSSPRVRFVDLSYLDDDPKVRVFLRQFANQHGISLQSPVPLADPPVMKGYLNKYVNVAKGYQTRWFILENGVLSYYRHQEDELVASRGSISMKTGTLRVSATDRQKFDVSSTPSAGHTSGIQKWYIKANHSVEASRWTQAISNSMKWHKQDSKGRKSGESDASSTLYKTVRASLFHSSRHSSSIGGRGSDVESMASNRRDSPPNDDDGKSRRSERDDSSSSASLTKSVPHESTFELHGNSISAQLELTSQLIHNLSLPDDAPKQSKNLAIAMKDSFAAVQGMLNEYVNMVKTREEWYGKQLQKEREKSTMWEESLATVVREGEDLENELRARSRKRGSRFFDAATPGDGTVKQRRSIFIQKQASVLEEGTNFSEIFSEPYSGPPTAVPYTLQQPSMAPRSDTQTTITPASKMSIDDGYDTDEEDEFFDAIEAGTIPNLFIPDSLASPTHAESALPAEMKDSVRPYEGYQNLRDRLQITDERPNTSLWSVLKNSIGKDLTRISFPVSFNEPTSMLQRMAEDMEFSECLDIAAREKEPLLRVAYVAAFAMSNYSSTIGRIAKPFNPMLSETFEYVRFDKEYRYVSEQVSHHPPISACYAESPYWHYYGEVDAQNKFMGKSFEIRPTGVAHVDLAIPAELGPGYPKAKGISQAGKVFEHYTWKKVTTNISGFIVGSPTIDHYGDMKVVNHRTGEQCILTFKPRGWRGKDAFEISGVVLDAKGRVRYDIAGRWNSQLIAREVGTGSGALLPDAYASGPNSPSASPNQHLLLWRNSEKPAGSPFNLTPFAVTLNDCPKETLKPYVCPTDCRLRVDQRSFEMGKYDLANELKQAQEEKQRSIRKAREDGDIPPHRPRWFRAETDGDTGDRVWTPSRVGDDLEYWIERERVWKAKQLGGDTQWKDVDMIFIDEPEDLK